MWFFSYEYSVTSKQDFWNFSALVVDAVYIVFDFLKLNRRGFILKVAFTTAVWLKGFFLVEL